jgi:predicted RNA-binding protein
MCELNAIILDGNNKKTLMEDAVRLVVNNDEITITGIFGDSITIRGTIVHVDITKQEALLQKID